MTEPEEEQEKTAKTDAILHPPTANPRRTRVSAEDAERRRLDREGGEDSTEGEPAEEAGTDGAGRSDGAGRADEAEER